MKRTLFIIPALIIFTLLAFLPAISGDNYLNSFDGGIHNMILTQNAALTSGIGVYEASAGIGVTTLRPSPASIYWNPAGLGFLKRGGILLEAVPGFSYSPDVSQDIKTETDKNLEDNFQLNHPVYGPSIIVYPDFTFEGGQKAQAVSALALAVPYRNFFLGFAYYQAYALNVNLISAGLENLITSLEDDPADNATIFTRTDINLLLDLKADAYAFSCGKSISKTSALGLTVTRLNASTTINGLLAPEGVFTRRGIEKSFNNPAEGYNNDFYSSMIGSFDGGAWGIKAGFAYHPSANLSVDLVYSHYGDLTLDGEMEIIQYFYPAMNLNADEAAGEETFNINNIENFAQPTETVAADNEPGDQMTINLPSSISFGLAFRRISFSLTKYTGELSYSLDLARDGIPATYSRGLKPNTGFLLGFDFKYIRLSFGGITGEEVISGYKDKDGVPIEPTTGIIIPRFSLGTGFRINQDWKMDILLLSMPDLFGSVLKLGATYTF